MSWINHITREDFYRARRRAFIARLLAPLTRRPNELLSLEEVRARLSVRGQHHLGHRTVPLDHIVGSEGRYADFDRSFAPRHEATRFRWMSIDRAHHEAVTLAPVALYKLGDVYFVQDGHHRISVARLQGQLAIDAIVTELVVDVPLSPGLSARDLRLKEEYADFLSWTGLAQLRPEQRIELSEPGGYLNLVSHINGHRYFMGLERGRAVPREEAVADWYDTVYMPLVSVLREREVLRAFPGRSEADLYRWIMDHRWYLREHSGTDPGPLIATADYLRRFGRLSLSRLTQRLLGPMLGARLLSVAQ